MDEVPSICGSDAALGSTRASGDMVVTYRLHIDRPYYRTLIARYYQQRPFIFRLPVQFGLLALITAGLFISLVVGPLESRVGIGLTIAALVLFGGVALTKWGKYLRLRNRTDFGSEVVLTMSVDGLAARGRHSQREWNWAAYPRAVRYADGIMLLRRGVIRWLPDAAILDGTPADATELVRSKSALSEIA